MSELTLDLEKLCEEFEKEVRSRGLDLDDEFYERVKRALDRHCKSPAWIERILESVYSNVPEMNERIARHARSILGRESA